MDGSWNRGIRALGVLSRPGKETFSYLFPNMKSERDGEPEQIKTVALLMMGIKRRREKGVRVPDLRPSSSSDILNGISNEAVSGKGLETARPFFPLFLPNHL